MAASPPAESELEVAFFRDLQKELKKISLFYSSEEKRCQSRFHQLRAVLKDLKVCLPSAGRAVTSGFGLTRRSVVSPLSDSNKSMRSKRSA